MKPLQIFIDEDLHRDLKIWAAQEDTTVSELVRLAVASVLSERAGGSVSGLKSGDGQGSQDTPEIEQQPAPPKTKTCKHGSALGFCKFGCKK